MISLPPWANGPFELLLHAEGHLRAGEDFDRRIALISFDNAIEVAITTYLTLNPIQRGNRSYQNTDVEKWLNNYPSKLAFFDTELVARKLTWKVHQSHILWAHDHRNEQYHGGMKGTPEKNVLSVTRRAALWIFSLLFDIIDAEKLLDHAIADIVPPAPPQPDAAFDHAIDREYGMVEIGDHAFYASEVLFSVDYWAYRDAGARLCQNSPSADGQEQPK
jgi:hypothetical protein